MMRISTLYFFLLCCALFVLMTCSVGEKDTSPPKQCESLKLDNNELLSEESKKIYDAIPIQYQQIFVDRFIKTTTTTTRNSEITKKEDTRNIFSMFECATFHMKSDSEKFYPKFVGADSKHHKKTAKKGYSLLMQGVKEEFKIPIELEDMIKDFAAAEAQCDVKPQFQAKVKMRDYFYDICGYLSRYADEKVKPFLTDKSYHNAEVLMRKIIKPGFNDAQKKTAIIEFAKFYARIRHWSNRFVYNCIAIYFQKGAELAKKKGRKVAVYEVLDDIKMLTPLRFSENDVNRLNLLVEIMYHSQTEKYFHKSYEYLDLHKKTITELIPLIVNLDECPLEGWA